METRFQNIELRANGRRLTGYAALFGSEARIGGGVVETIAPGAFARTLTQRADILALVDHDPTRVLARTRSGSLRLSEDTRGLAFDLDVPDTQAGRDVLTLAERGDLGGMSFGFEAIDEHVDGARRELRALDLFEISVVAAFPAYEGTVINARSHFAGHPMRDAAARRLRILELLK
ncbi:HK97 family phage prohead protease [Epibacterium sp. MM17-32]|uniref:HK97 family phage prohead protease n=1 Tax=Epibacterium sp. MM17-32 TaxID=2917734 RepID=UPI001EF4C8CD|nr:HK97 family phage prohead protease [Epibacterium sp. MM17-32]MCG7630656.1 HK97 family phage prohead protease [Epibacterium sp. MM17-32]